MAKLRVTRAGVAFAAAAAAVILSSQLDTISFVTVGPFEWLRRRASHIGPFRLFGADTFSA